MGVNSHSLTKTANLLKVPDEKIKDLNDSN